MDVTAFGALLLALPDLAIPLLDWLTSALPLISGALAATLVAYGRERLVPRLPKRYLPFLMPFIASAAAVVAQKYGVDLGDFNPETADLDAWQTAVAGFMTGAFGTWAYEARKQLAAKKTPAPEAPAPNVHPADPTGGAA